MCPDYVWLWVGLQGPVRFWPFIIPFDPAKATALGGQKLATSSLVFIYHPLAA